MSRTVGDADNIFYQARMLAAARNTDFESRASTEVLVGINSTRLYQIERGCVSRIVTNCSLWTRNMMRRSF